MRQGRQQTYVSMQDKAERFGASVQQVGYFGRLAMHAVHDLSLPKDARRSDPGLTNHGHPRISVYPLGVERWCK
jgi:hypothetical protein